MRASECSQDDGVVQRWGDGLEGSLQRKKTATISSQLGYLNQGGTLPLVTSTRSKANKQWPMSRLG